MQKMIWHDKRLAGKPPRIATNIYSVDEKVPILHALGWITSYAKMQGGLSDLYIMAHGYSRGLHDGIEQISTSDLGFGLCLCKESLTNANVGLTTMLSGLIQVITLYACGPAHTRRGFAGTVADGTRFCQELACNTGAEVIAATQTQYYDPGGWFSRMDFGAWEGPVYRFSPDGSVSRHTPS